MKTLDLPTQSELLELLPLLTEQEKEELDWLILSNPQDLSWRDWLALNFPRAAYHPMPPEGRHARLWEWFEGLTPGMRPRPRGEYWPRGGAKSSTAELGVVRVGTKMVDVDGEVRPSRRFVLYVSGTQDQANVHVEAIRQKFEDLGVERSVGKYGHSKGWKVDLLRTANGFNVLALGLDAAARGVKLDDFRPDLIILDDVDARHEKPESVQKKIETITESILPAGSTDCAILFVQNLIHENSIASQLENGKADFLLGREQFPAEPAVRGLKYEQQQQEDGTMRYVITEGEATWEGQNLETCEQQLNDWGRAAFEREAQHNVTLVEDGLWKRERDIDPFRISRVELPQPLIRIGVGIDPSATSDGDESGVIVAATAWIAGVLHGFVLDDASLQGSPRAWAQAAVDAYHYWKGDVMVAESNNGGEMVSVTIDTIPGAPSVSLVHASRGKLTRAEPVQKLYEDGRVHHLRGSDFTNLENELCRWSPGDPSPNRMDALVWILTELMLNGSSSSFSKRYDKRK